MPNNRTRSVFVPVHTALTGEAFIKRFGDDAWIKALELREAAWKEGNIEKSAEYWRVMREIIDLKGPNL